MPSYNDLTGSPSEIATSSVSSATATVTITNANVRNAVAIFGVFITTSAVPAGVVAATLSDGTTTLTINLPATIFPAGFALNFPSGHPWVSLAGVNVVLTVPSTGTLCNASLFYRLVAAK